MMYRNWQAEVFREKYNFKRPVNVWLKGWYSAIYNFLTVTGNDISPEPEEEEEEESE